MNKGDKVRIKSSHRFHSGRIGSFQFEGEGPSKGTYVFADADKVNPMTFFAVGPEDFEILSKE